MRMSSTTAPATSVLVPTPTISRARLSARSLASLGVRPRSRIAVLYIVGTIVSGKSTYDAPAANSSGSDTVVIRSGGSSRLERQGDRAAHRQPRGSSVASDVIWRELTITREQQPSRPIIASMSIWRRPVATTSLFPRSRSWRSLGP